jgi:hypothetical protein
MIFLNAVYLLFLTPSVLGSPLTQLNLELKDILQPRDVSCNPENMEIGVVSSRGPRGRNEYLLLTSLAMIVIRSLL